MHSHLTRLDVALWIVTIALKTALPVIMVWRHNWRDVPIFFAFTVTLWAKSCALFAVSSYGTPVDYFLWYWRLLAIEQCLLMGAVVELIYEVCLPGRMLNWRVMRFLLYPIAFAGLLSYSISHASAPTPFPILNGFMAGERFAAWTAMISLGLLLVFASAFSVEWRRHASYIAIGIGCFLLFGGVISVPQIYFHGPMRQLFIAASSVSAAGACAIWMYGLWRPIAPGDSASESIERLQVLLKISDLQTDEVRQVLR